MALVMFHCLWRDGSAELVSSGYALAGHWSRKCEGVRTSRPSRDWVVMATSGLLLRQAST